VARSPGTSVVSLIATLLVVFVVVFTAGKAWKKS
jgi:hypothetical protein